MPFSENVVLKVIGLTNIKDPELCPNCAKMNEYELKSNAEIVEWVECRQYKRMFHSSSLKGPTNFLTQFTVAVSANSYTIHRRKDYFECDNTNQFMLT